MDGFQFNFLLRDSENDLVADALNVDNKLPIIETIEKMMMAEALQGCLSRCFPKIETLKTGQREASEALISRRDVIAI